MRSESIARYDDYRDAESAVDRLTDKGFAVENISIVGRDLKAVTPQRTTFWRRVGAGLVLGAWTGGLTGLTFWLFDWYSTTVDVAGWIPVALFFGAVAGMLATAVMHVLTYRRRRRQSLASVQPNAYELIIDVDKIADVRELMSDSVTVDVTESRTNV